jgi:ComF family protein
MTCGLRMGLAAPHCGQCLREPPPFTRTVCAVDYAFPWDALITHFKFHHQVELAGALAALLHTAVQNAGAASQVDCVVPVPLSPQRLQQRGYNQAWELARRTARAFSLPAHAQALERTLDTTAQAALHRAERGRNLRNAFHVPPAARPHLAGRRVALVDDVMTTGATLREATAALLRGGAANVQLWVLARTPDG